MSRPEAGAPPLLRPFSAPSPPVLHPSSAYLLQGQWWRSGGGGAALGDLAPGTALLLLVGFDSGVVHHGQLGVLAVPQAREDVLDGGGGAGGDRQGGVLFTGSAFTQFN